MDTTLIRKSVPELRFRSGRRVGKRGSRGNRTGALQMEYLILALLVATACVYAVFVFGRSVYTSMQAASDGATLRHTEAQEGLIERREHRQEDADRSRDYHDSMHQ